MSEERSRGQEPDMAYAFTDHSHLTYDWMGHKDMAMSCADQPDYRVAARVRMLMRDQLDHEAVCVMARDRIMALSKEVARLDAALRKASEPTPMSEIPEAERHYREADERTRT